MCSAHSTRSCMTCTPAKGRRVARMHVCELVHECAVVNAGGAHMQIENVQHRHPILVRACVRLSLKQKRETMLAVKTSPSSSEGKGPPRAKIPEPYSCTRARLSSQPYLCTSGPGSYEHMRQQVYTHTGSYEHMRQQAYAHTGSYEHMQQQAYARKGSYEHMRQQAYTHTGSSKTCGSRHMPA